MLAFIMTVDLFINSRKAQAQCQRIWLATCDLMNMDNCSRPCPRTVTSMVTSMKWYTDFHDWEIAEDNEPTELRGGKVLKLCTDN